MKTIRLLTLLLALPSLLLAVPPSVPELLNFQGKVAVGATPFSGPGYFKFALVDGTGATTYWSNDGTSAAGSEPTGVVTLTVSNGLYSLQLGDIALANMTAVPAAVFSNPDVRLRVWFDDGTNGSQQLAPDQRVADVGYAMNAASALVVPDGSITSAKIAAGAIMGTQIAANTITGAQLAPGLTLDGTTIGTFSGDGSALTNLPAPANVWGLGGNVDTIPGIHFLGTSDYQALEFRVNNSPALRIEPTAGTPNLIGGYVGNSVAFGVVGATVAGGGDSGAVNSVSNDYGAVGGGYYNHVNGDNGTIAGGQFNRVDAFFGTIGGGGGNEVYEDLSTIGGGRESRVFGRFTTIGGGSFNEAEGDSSAIGGGRFNYAAGHHSTIGGGERNQASGSWSCVPGGSNNTAAGQSSFAAGQSAKANDDGSFVWADSTGLELVSSQINEFSVRASGGVRFFSDADSTVGVTLAPGGTSWETISDRNKKKNFQPVNGADVLAKLALVVVQKWNYRTAADDAVPHIGPMAQDFKAAFYPGRNDKVISTLEFDGVELAAIQGLNEKLAAKDAEVAALRKQLADQSARTQNIEASLAALEAKDHAREARLTRLEEGLDNRPARAVNAVFGSAAR